MVELDTLVQRGNRHAAVLATQSVEQMAALARERFGFHQFRVARKQEERSQRLAEKARDKLAHLEQLPGSHDLERKKAVVQAAIERARARRAPKG
jgi:electron transport complex protein RnfB